MEEKSKETSDKAKQDTPDFAVEFKKFVEVFDANAQLNREQTNHIFGSAHQEVNRLYELFEAQSESAKKSAEKIARFQSIKFAQAIAGLVITVLLAAATFFLNDHFNRLAHEREVSREEVRQKLAKLNAISDALTDVREVKDEALLRCETEQYNKKEIELKRLVARTNLIKSVRNADFFFGDDVYKEVTDFVNWERSFTDYCSKNLPSDSIWREKHKAIENLAQKYFPESTFNAPR